MIGYIPSAALCVVHLPSELIAMEMGQRQNAPKATKLMSRARAYHDASMIHRDGHRAWTFVTVKTTAKT